MDFISIEDYYGAWTNEPSATDERKRASKAFLSKVNSLLETAVEDGVKLVKSHKTGTHISGEKDGFGGFRPKWCKQGAEHSSHKEGRGVDIADHDGSLDAWCMKHEHILKEHGLCMEHPSATDGWCHLSDRYPPSGRTVFYP